MNLGKYKTTDLSKHSKCAKFFIKRNSLVAAIGKKKLIRKALGERKKKTKQLLTVKVRIWIPFILLGHFNSNESGWAAPANSARRVADLNVRHNDHRSTSEYKLFYVNTSSWGLHKYRIRQSVIFFFFLCFIFPLFSSNIPRLGWLYADAGTYFKKLQLPYDSSAKRLSFNLNQQMCGAET